MVSSIWIIQLWIALLMTASNLYYIVNADRRGCCSHIPNRSRYEPCKDACDQAWISSGPLQQLEVFSTAYRHCPDSLQSFWECIGTNYQVLTDVETWEGRACCELAYSSHCKSVCQSATSISDLETSCNAQNEERLYSCVRRQTGSIACCRGVQSKHCQAACRAMFANSDSGSSILRDNLLDSCTIQEPHVPSCVNNWTRNQGQTTLATQSNQCCSKGESMRCKQTCYRAFTRLNNQEEIINSLVPVCGPVSGIAPLWRCFLLSESSNNEGRQLVDKELSPMDGVSLRCCSRANTLQCKSLCTLLYSSRSSSAYEDFKSTCQNNPMETRMNQCLQNVEEPCKIGCKSLEFCNNFNNRNDGMFRSCHAKADLAARSEYSSWLRERAIRLPNSEIVPIKNIRTCEPNLWKAISCALNVKPCSSQSITYKICKSDCIRILSRCIDDSVTSYNVGSLCDSLPVSEDVNQCVPLSQYIEPVKVNLDIDLSNPCVPNPCNISQVCEVNQQYPLCQKSHRSCLPHVCHSGCAVGEASPLRVPANYHVKMLNTVSASPLRCQKICKCGHNGFLTHCKETYCEPTDSCYLSADSIVEHGTKFTNDCNQCVCQTGDVICTKKYCPPQKTRLEITNNSGLPCGCQPVYQPVCTKNGQVFSSACLAKCSGFKASDYVDNNCAAKNPCGSASSCQRGYKCVPERRICLSTTSHCPQHTCVPVNCTKGGHGVACDNQGKQHANVCTLLARRKQLSYTGQCMTHCAHQSAVCGVNGETYLNECSALADRVLVDYPSHCQSSPNVPTHPTTEKDSVCSYIKCESTVPEWCEGFNPPGACCPVCGAQIKSLYSTKYINTMISSSDLMYITTKDIATHIGHHLSNKHCSVYVYISFEKELVILLLPSSKTPTSMEIDYCNLDARRINNMIENQNPILKTDVTLSSLLTAALHTSRIIPVTVSDCFTITSSQVILTFMLLLVYEVT